MANKIATIHNSNEFDVFIFTHVRTQLTATRTAVSTNRSRVLVLVTTPSEGQLPVSLPADAESGSGFCWELEMHFMLWLCWDHPTEKSKISTSPRTAVQQYTTTSPSSSAKTLSASDGLLKNKHVALKDTITGMYIPAYNMYLRFENESCKISFQIPRHAPVEIIINDANASANLPFRGPTFLTATTKTSAAMNDINNIFA